MAKRKRVEPANPAREQAASKKNKPIASKKESLEKQHLEASTTPHQPFTLQIVTGSYDRVLHGILATVSADGNALFADTFLFNAHPSQIRCIAISPPSVPAPGQDQKVLLASGSTDPKINIYSLSAHPPKRRERDDLAKVSVRPILENSKNRELGLYNPHDSTVTKLIFPTRSKLISASEDSTIAVAKTRNWEQMSTIKAPIPKAQGRPSGDTAALGDTPAGINDFAVHPSMKLLLSVSRGERCMRLWNLLTGKKAAVLNFSKEMLMEVGEGRHSTGEGRKVVWGPGADSEEFAIGFDRNVIVFGMDSLPRCRVMPDNRTKIHQFQYLTGLEIPILAVSTEDGRICFFSTAEEDLTSSDGDSGKLKVAKAIAHIGGKETGTIGRIKDFTVVQRKEGPSTVWYIVTGSSDGNVRLWRLTLEELMTAVQREAEAGEKVLEGTVLGKLLGWYGTDNRITCTAAFEMIPRAAGVDDSDDGLDFDEVNEDEEDEGSEDDA